MAAACLDSCSVAVALSDGTVTVLCTTAGGGVAASTGGAASTSALTMSQVRACLDLLCYGVLRMQLCCSAVCFCGLLPDGPFSPDQVYSKRLTCFTGGKLAAAPPKPPKRKAGKASQDDSSSAAEQGGQLSLCRYGKDYILLSGSCRPVAA